MATGGPQLPWAIRVCMQVWSGLLGRMPKKSMLMPAPPPAQLTGNLFVIDVSAIERGWSMLPPQHIWSQHGAASRASLPRRWAAMAALAPGVPLCLSCDAGPAPVLSDSTAASHKYTHMAAPRVMHPQSSADLCRSHIAGWAVQLRAISCQDIFNPLAGAD